MVLGSNCVLNKKDGTTLEMNGECPYDMGGYFLVNGQEKIVMSIEKMVDNKIIV